MNLQFYWFDFNGVVTSGCKLDEPDGNDFADPQFNGLCNFLVDDGGLSVGSTLDALGEGLIAIDKVLSGESSKRTWVREDWGCDLDQKTVRVFSRQDEEWYESVPSESFRQALAAWIEFLKLPPDLGRKQVVRV